MKVHFEIFNIREQFARVLQQDMAEHDEEILRRLGADLARVDDIIMPREKNQVTPLSPDVLQYSRLVYLA